MKVQLIVVQGKPEGKVIPLVGPKFKIGRGETCHLRPNSEQVSREHAEFTLTADTVTVRDLGSRNGTLVNGKALTEAYHLKDRDLVQVGPLTFAVSIQGAPAAAKPAAAAPAKASPEDVGHDDIEAWLIADAKNPAPERPSGVYSGDTLTITAFKDGLTPKPESAAEGSDDEYERQGDAEEGLESEGEGEGDEEEPDAAALTEEMPEDFIDESNPFYVKKKPAADQAPAKPQYKDTSDAASDILRKMMERRRGSR
jgi:predicted component of type VI protein secretion system